MSRSDATKNREIVRRALELMRTGAPGIDARFAEQACWILPQSSASGCASIPAAGRGRRGSRRARRAGRPTTRHEHGRPGRGERRSREA